MAGRSVSNSSLAEVASACKVARSTVSRVLSGDPAFSVRPEVASHIRNMAAKLQYRPSLAARALRSSSSRLIAVMGTQNMPVSFGFANHTLRSLVDSLHAHGFDVISTYPNPQRAEQELPPWRIDGAVVASARDDHSWRALEIGGIPYVAVNGCCGPAGWEVAPDDADGMRQALDHLVSLGHRRIAYISRSGAVYGDAAGHPSVTARHQAYLAWMVGHGLEPVPGHDAEFPSYDQAIQQMVMECGATAAVAYDHFTAIDVLGAAHRMGVPVPRRLSIVCFNNEFPTEQMTPSLTVVAMPADEMGRAAAGLLVQRLANESAEAPHRIVLPEQLIVRQSSIPLVSD